MNTIYPETQTSMGPHNLTNIVFFQKSQQKKLEDQQKKTNDQKPKGGKCYRRHLKATTVTKKNQLIIKTIIHILFNFHFEGYRFSFY